MSKTKFIVDDEPLFAQCHGSTLAQLPDGRIITAWFGGTRESHPDTGIYSSILEPGADGWNQIQLVHKISDEAHWNPVFMMDKGETLHLWFKTGAHPWSWETWHSVADSSTLTWSTPKLLKGQDGAGGHCRGPVRNKPIVLSDGTWLAPSSHEEKLILEKTKKPYQLVPIKGKPKDLDSYYAMIDRWNSFADLSSDGGENWEKTDYIPRPQEANDSGGVIQPAAWESSPGKVHMFLRSTWGTIHRTDSEDYGKTWTPSYNSGLPNNNSGIEVCNLGDGALALVYNPISGNWAGRGVLRVSFSNDNGVTWLGDFDLEHSGVGSYAYPSAIVTDEGLAVSYTWNRVSICCALLKVDKEAILAGSADCCGLLNPQTRPASMQSRRMSKMNISRAHKVQLRQQRLELNKSYDGVVDWEARKDFLVE